MKPLSSGTLRHRITIQHDTGNTTDDNGQTIQNWSDFTKSYAAIEPMSGRELWNAQQVQPDVTHKITMRYQAGVTPKMQIVYGSRTFGILSVLNAEERNYRLELLAKESL